MSVDQGQFEAGRSLGLTYVQTMWHIIIPQALKNVLPALGNEFITLLKETSICGYIALTDVTHGANTVRSQTYDPYMPLFAAALIYLVSVSFLSALMKDWKGDCVSMSGEVLFEIKQLCKSFGKVQVLDHIDATIRKGEVVAIIGPSGSGKSTFLRSLNLLEMSDERGNPF